MTEYRWGTSWRPAAADRVDANIAGKTVEQLAAANGGVCAPTALVEASRPEDSPTHELFESWEEHENSEKWLAHEARNIIRALILPPKTDRPIPLIIPAFINVKREDHRGYAPLAVVLSDQELHEQAIRNALSAAKSLKRRFDTLSELTPLWETLEKLEADLGLTDIE